MACLLFYATNCTIPQGRSHNRISDWSNSPPAIRRCGKNRTHFYLLAKHRKKPQAPLRRVRLRKKVRNTFCCIKTLALRYVTLRYGMLETMLQ